MLCGLCNHARGESESGCSNPLLDAGKAVLLDVAGLLLHAGQAVPRQVNRSQLSSRQEFAPGLVADYCLWYPAANGPECVKTPEQTLAMISENLIARETHETIYPG